eukprot:15334838-Ditylum_brightwellii.AAC.1
MEAREIKEEDEGGGYDFVTVLGALPLSGNLPGVYKTGRQHVFIEIDAGGASMHWHSTSTITSVLSKGANQF